MSDSDNMKLAYIEEDAFGQIKEGGTLKQLRFTSESLHQETSTNQSAEIRPDRQISGISRNNVSAAGEINFELSYGAQDDLIKAALMADSGWASLPSITAKTIAAVAIGNKLTDSGEGFLLAGFKQGQRILVSGFTGTETTANGMFTIDTVTASQMSLIGGQSLIDDEAGESVTIQAIQPTIVGQTISAAADDNSLNDSAKGFLIAGFAPGQWIRVSGFAGTGTTANGYFKILTAAAGKLVVAGSQPLVNDEGGVDVTIEAGDAIANGSTAPSYNIEKHYTDINTFAIETGMTVDQFTLNITGEAIVTGGVTFLGSKEVSADASSGVGYQLPPTNEVVNAVDHVLDILEGGVNFDARSLSLTLQNNLRTRLKIGNLGAISIGKGKCAVTGTLQAYFENRSMLDKYLNFASSSLAILLKDAAGNSYILDLPRVKYTSGQRVAGGQNQDIIADMGFSAYAHETENVTIRLVRFAA